VRETARRNLYTGKTYNSVDFIRQFRVDYAVIGASAIDMDGTLLDFDFREVKVAQAIIETARETILVADAMKFERKAPVRIGHLEQMDAFVTDEMPPGRSSTSVMPLG
jgi:DeoR family glycerol-3-phosphate regulon repressor